MLAVGGGGGGGSITAAVKAVKMERYLSAVPVMASPPPPNSNAAVGNGEEEAFELQLKEMRPLAPSFQHGPVCTAVDGCALCGEAALRVCVYRRSPVSRFDTLFPRASKEIMSLHGLWSLWLL